MITSSLSVDNFKTQQTSKQREQRWDCEHCIARTHKNKRGFTIFTVKTLYFAYNKLYICLIYRYLKKTKIFSINAESDSSKWEFVVLSLWCFLPVNKEMGIDKPLSRFSPESPYSSSSWRAAPPVSGVEAWCCLASLTSPDLPALWAWRRPGPGRSGDRTWRVCPH